MASRNNKRGSSALDSLMAGFAAGAAAFVIYAMPQPLFDGMVALSGIGMILPAAQPPLGTTARAAVMIAAAICSFALVWFVLRALSKPSAPRRKREELEELEMAPPRLRRADMHPDAPSRRPILAGVDLGRSFDEIGTDRDPPVEETEAAQDEERDEDALLSEGEPLYAPSAYGAEPAEDTAELDEPEDFTFTAAQEEFQAEEPFEGPTEEAYSPFSRADADREPNEAEAENDDAKVAFAEVPFPISPRNTQNVESFADQLPQDEEGETEIPQLMQRLEAGLVRRRRGRWTPPAPETTNGSAAPGVDQLDKRLRGAIDELQRLASRGN